MILQADAGCRLVQRLHLANAGRISFIPASNEENSHVYNEPSRQGRLCAFACSGIFDSKGFHVSIDQSVQCADMFIFELMAKNKVSFCKAAEGDDAVARPLTITQQMEI